MTLAIRRDDANRDMASQNVRLGDVARRLGLGEPILEELPTNVADGQIIIYRANITSGNSDGPVLWRLRYNAASSSSHKWENAGCAPLYANVESEDAKEWEVTAINTLQAVKGSPVFTTPFAGDWEVETGYMIVMKGSNALIRCGTVPAGIDGDVTGQQEVINGAQTIMVQRNRVLSLAAGTNLQVGVISGFKGKMQLWDPHMFITPVRVG